MSKNRYMKTIAAMNKILVYCHEHYNECDSKGQSELAEVNQAAKDAVELLKAQRKVIRDLCTLGYPHNFQHEAPWVAQYCRDVSGVITEAFEVNDNDDTLIDFSRQMCMKNHECQFDDGFPSDLGKNDFDQIGDLFMECSMCGCQIGTMYFIAIQAAELRERLRVCEPINFHCMGFQDAEKILTYAGIGCDVLSPDGFIHWLKTQMIRDPRFKDEFRGEQG